MILDHCGDYAELEKKDCPKAFDIMKKKLAS